MHLPAEQLRSEAVNTRQLREFICARERNERQRYGGSGSGFSGSSFEPGKTVEKSSMGEEIYVNETERETAGLLRALREQSKRNVRTPRTVRRQRESDGARSSPRAHQQVVKRFQLPSVPDAEIA